MCAPRLDWLSVARQKVSSACRVLEAVFSSSSNSTGFRIRAAQGQAADHGLAEHGFTDWATHVAASLFFTLFPADCRICGFPLLRVSRLPVCAKCLIAPRPLKGSYCTVCGEALQVPAYIDLGETDPLEADRVEVEARCLLCQLTDPPFERARSEEHTSELQSPDHLVCRLLLEKKKST